MKKIGITQKKPHRSSYDVHQLCNSNINATVYICFSTRQH